MDLSLTTYNERAKEQEEAKWAENQRAKRASTEAGGAEEKNHQSPPKLAAAPIERDHSMKKS